MTFPINNMTANILHDTIERSRREEKKMTIPEHNLPMRERPIIEPKKRKKEEWPMDSSNQGVGYKCHCDKIYYTKKDRTDCIKRNHLPKYNLAAVKELIDYYDKYHEEWEISMCPGDYTDLSILIKRIRGDQ